MTWDAAPVNLRDHLGKPLERAVRVAIVGAGARGWAYARHLDDSEGRAVVGASSSAFTTPNTSTRPRPFAAAGYDILLEKPMAPTLVECRRIVAAAEEANVWLGVCHVLRYTPYTSLVRSLVQGGAIGDIVNVQHLEPVGFWHFALPSRTRSPTQPYEPQGAHPGPAGEQLHRGRRT